MFSSPYKALLIICFNSKRVERNKPAAKWPAMASITEAVFTFDSHPTNGDGNTTLCPRFGKHSSRSQLHLWFHLFRINHICLFVASFLLRFDSSSFISQVSTRHELVSVCWETTGKYMLAVLGPIEGTDSKMVVMKNPTKVDTRDLFLQSSDPIAITSCHVQQMLAQSGCGERLNQMFG